MERSRNAEHPKMRLLCMLLLSIFAVQFGGCATAAKQATEPAAVPDKVVITGIDIEDNLLTIKADGPFVYTVYKPGDPYKAVIELPDVRAGNFTGKIAADRKGIAEVRSSQMETPSLMTRLEVLLQSPSLLEPEYGGNSLKLRIKEEISMKKDPPARIIPAMHEEDSLPKASAEPATVKAVMNTQGLPLSKATEISSIAFDVSSGAVKVLIQGNGTMTPNVFPLGNRIVIDVEDVALNTPMPSSVISPVKGIRSGKYKDKVRLVLDLKEKTNFDVTAIGDSIVVALKRVEMKTPEPTFAAEADEPAVRREVIAREVTAGDASETEEPAPAIEIKAAVPNGSRCQEYLDGKETVNFDFQDQDIVPILRLFADISGCNCFIHPDVKGRASMKFRDVPWNQAFDTILKTFSLGRNVEGSVIRIAPHKIFAQESEEKAKAIEAGIRAEPLESRIFPISYADVGMVESAIKNAKILSTRGNINVDKRTSTMLVKDVSGVFPEVENILQTLDRPTPQVLIEARIVEANTASTRDLGIQWGLNLSATNTLSSIGGLSGIPNLASGPFTGKNYLVDFPSKSAAPLSGSGFSFGIINPSRTVGLDLQLSALETIGKLKVISNPKVLTVDNGKAKILQGKSIAVRKLTSEGTVSSEFKDIALELIVTPHITPDKSVAMVVEIKKEELDPTVPSVDGVPGTDKKEANTNVIIKDGETVVIGGMYKVTTNDTQTGVPGLMKLPILGWLFKSDQRKEDTVELLIFVTPRILEKP